MFETALITDERHRPPGSMPQTKVEDDAR